MSGMRSLCSLVLVWVAVAYATASILAADEKGGGFGIGPGMVLVENIHPGEGEVDVNKTTSFSFEVENGTDEKHVFTVTPRTAKSTIGTWEKGYESIPDIAWLRLDKNEIEVPAKSTGKVNLFINIPNKLELFNRKWMAVIACSPGRKAEGNGSSVGLIVASRVQIETCPKDETDGANSGDLGLIPSSWLMPDARPGDSWRKEFKFRNNTAEEHTYTFKRLSEVEKEDVRHDRYFGQGFTKLDKESWAQFSDKSFSLKSGETKGIMVSVKVSKDAKTGNRYEELLFLQDEKEQLNFIRLRTELAPATASADDGSKKAP